MIVCIKEALLRRHAHVHVLQESFSFGEQGQFLGAVRCTELPNEESEKRLQREKNTHNG